MLGQSDRLRFAFSESVKRRGRVDGRFEHLITQMSEERGIRILAMRHSGLGCPDFGLNGVGHDDLEQIQTVRYDFGPIGRGPERRVNDSQWPGGRAAGHDCFEGRS